MASKGRIAHLDVTKGFCIIMVCLYHALLLIYVNELGGVIVSLLKMFFLTSFFVVSGFLDEKIIEKDKGVFDLLLLKKIKMLVPFLIYGFVIIIINYCLGISDINNGVKKLLFGERSLGLWFLLGIMICRINTIIASSFTASTRPIHSKESCLMEFSVLYILLTYLFYHFIPHAVVKYVCSEYAHFYLIGIWLIHFKVLSLVKFKNAITLLILSLIAFVCSWFYGVIDDFWPKTLMRLPFTLSVVAIISKLNTQNTLYRIVQNIGERSLDIYILHIVTLVAIKAICIQYLSKDALWSVCFLTIIFFIIPYSVSLLCGSNQLYEFSMGRFKRTTLMQ